MEVFDGKQTSWEGLWYHPEYGGFRSSVISLAKLREFKGNVVLYVRKNKYYEKGTNRPNYSFCIKDSKSKLFTEIEVKPDETYMSLSDVDFDDESIKEIRELMGAYEEGGMYYTSDGERLYTASEAQSACRQAAMDGQNGYTDVLISDYLD